MENKILATKKLELPKYSLQALWMQNQISVRYLMMGRKLIM